MDNEIFLFAPDIFKWSLFFLFHVAPTSDELVLPIDSTADDIICLSPNLMCDVLSFRLVWFVCLWMVSVCVAFLVDPELLFIWLYCMGVCPMPLLVLQSPFIFCSPLFFTLLNFKHSVKGCRALCSQQWTLSLLYRFPCHRSLCIR